MKLLAKIAPPPANSHLVTKIFSIAALVICVAIQASAQIAQPSATATPAPEAINIPPEINISALLKKIDPAKQAAAKTELQALNKAFVDNTLEILTFIRNQKDWSATAVKSSVVQAAFNKNYYSRTKLVERQIVLYDKYGVLAELKRPGANVTEVLAKYRAAVTEIISRGKVFQVSIVQKVASLSGLESTSKLLASIAGATSFVSEAFAEGASTVKVPGTIVIVEFVTEMGCDGNVYPTKRHIESYDKQVSSATAVGDIFADMQALETYSLENKCDEVNGQKIYKVIYKESKQTIMRKQACTRNFAPPQLVSVRVCNHEGTSDLSEMYDGAQSGCGCVNEAPKLDSFGNAPADYQGWCNHARFNKPQWKVTPLDSQTCDFEPLF